MKLRKPSGTVVEATISRGKNKIILMMSGESTGARTQVELAEYIKEKNNVNEKLEDFEVLEASELERKLLKEAGHIMKNL
jgi:hypothetical protein